MKKIVIHCASGIMNSGDECILDVVVREFCKKYEITVISLNAEYTKKMHPEVKVVGNGDKAWKDAVRECDLFILGGGGLIQDTTTIFNVSRWLQKLKYAIRCHKKTMILANSFEPVKYGFNKRMIKRWVQKADVVTVRDPISLDIIKNIGIDKAVLTADPVFGYVMEDDKDQGTEYPEKFITLTVRHWYDTHPLIPVKIVNRLGIRSKKNQEKYSRYIHSIAEVVEWVNQELKMPVAFLSFCVNRDDKVANDILNLVSNKSDNLIINDKYQTPGAMISWIEHSQMLIGMRLHSLIYACLKTKPMAILSYQEKVKGMAAALEMTDVCFDVDTLEPSELIKAIRYVMDHKEEQQAKISSYTAQMREKQNENFKYIDSLLEEK